MAGGLFPDPTLIFDQRAPARVVSLVPSTTGSLIDLGLASLLVGCTDFCPLPEALESRVRKVGGPKTPDVNQILALQPDLVIANQEENSRLPVEELAAGGLTIWLTFPCTVKDAIRDLWTTANLFRSDAAMQRVALLEREVEWAGYAAESQLPVRYFCPIWQDITEDGTNWWMTFNGETYASDVLTLFGGVNVFADRQRRYPLAAEFDPGKTEPAGSRDTRYPRVALEEIVAASPELIFLPDEPYPYGAKEAQALIEALKETPAARAGRVFTLDGSLITWTGTRLAQALEEIPALFNV